MKTLIKSTYTPKEHWTWSTKMRDTVLYRSMIVTVLQEFCVSQGFLVHAIMAF